MNYAQPKILDEALELLASQSWAILSGGTDFYPARLERSASDNIMDIHALEELRHISQCPEHVRIGASVTWRELIDADLPAAFDGLKLAAREIGSVQIQNRATLVGNLCNASPAADGVPPLMTLDAQVELLSANGKRQLPLDQFVLGNRSTARKQDELVSAILVPHRATEGNSTFVKLGSRKYLIISISMVAGRLVCDDKNTVSHAALSVGSCSAVACRLSKLESALQGQLLSDNLVNLVTLDHMSGLTPIDDVRSNADYRMQASLELVRRTVALLVGSVS